MFNDFIQQRCESENAKSSTVGKVNKISCKSYIVTVFGDVLSQHGDWIWLGSLIETLAPLGFSERLIRTSVFRLVKEDWLQVKKSGRCSYYAFTETAKLHYEKAARRIYASDAKKWHGNWLLVLPTFVPEQQLSAFRRQMHWLGFSSLNAGSLSSDVLAHPSIDKQSLEETLTEMQLKESVIVFTSKTLDQYSDKALKKVVQTRWHLDELDLQYQKFINNYHHFYVELPTEITEQESFLLRTLLIHEYRRILLKDHELPIEMLPKDWAGYSAHGLVKHLYRQLAEKSLAYIQKSMRNSAGVLPNEKESFGLRFE